MFQSEISIPRDRVGVLIGKKGRVRRALEKKTETKIRITREGDVFVNGEDTLKLLIATSMIKAIARGFNPDIAYLLLNEHNTLEVININERRKRSPKKIIEARGRLIGTSGKARQTIESMTGTYISVYGKTVSIIGEIERVQIAKTAVTKLILGSKHGNAYKHIQLRQSRLRQ